MRVELPHVGESVTEAIIAKWLKKVGDQVEKYDPLAEIVTDKVNMELPSPATGVLTRLLAEEGETVPMGAVIAEIRVDGEEESSFAEAPASAASSPAEPQVADRIGTLLKDTAPVGPTGSGGPAPADSPDARKRLSPAVMRLASKHGIYLSLIEGTGIGGRVTSKDVRRHIDAGRAAEPSPTTEPTSSDEEERLPLSPVRRTIAERMVRSTTEIPEAWTVVEADVTGLVQLREGVKAEFQDRYGLRLTYLPYVLKAVAESLKSNRLVNSTWGGDAIVVMRRINIGVAIAAPDGLVVPVIHDTDTLSVTQLAKAVDDLATRARERRLVIDDVQGGTFTLTNTGALGSIQGKAIINHPQAAILNTEAIVQRPVVISDAIAIRSMMNLCLTFDHRILDGAEAGAFLGDVKSRLESIGPGTEIGD